MKKQMNGITLISLVITIIVLLILASVAINLTLGDNGIFTKAKEARDKTERATLIERIQTEILEKQLANEETNINKGDLETILDKYGDPQKDEEENITGLKPEGKEEIIPIEEIIGTNKIIDGKTLVQALKDGEINVGDYVNFTNPTSGSYTVTADKVGIDSSSSSVQIDNSNKEQKYEITSEKNQLNWRILGIENGKVKLIAGSPLESDVTVQSGQKAPYLFMYGAKAYTEGYKELDKICNKLYGNLPLVSEARSVKQNDINQITGITTADKIKEVNFDVVNGGKQYLEEYNFEDHYTPESWLNGKTKTTVHGNVDGYYYAINSQEEGMPTATVSEQRQYDMLFKNVEYPNGAQYWLASRGVVAYSSFAGFGPGLVRSGDGFAGAGTYRVFNSVGGREFDGWAGVRPVVLLESGVTTKQIHKIADPVDPVWNYSFGE